MDINYKQKDNYEELVGKPEEYLAPIIKGGEPRKFIRYNKPIPHILTPNKAPKLRGWYKDKHEEKGRRARPCYSEAFLTRPYGGFCPASCVFCLKEGTVIRTVIGDGINKFSGGFKKIEDINIGDLVWGFKDNKAVPSKVIGKWGGYKSDLLELTLSNNKILRVTSDHKIYTENRGWVEARDLDINNDILLDYTELQNVSNKSKRSEYMKKYNPMSSSEIAKRVGEKLKIKLKGLKRTEATKEAIRQSKIEYYKSHTHIWTGVPKSEEFKRQRAEDVKNGISGYRQSKRCSLNKEDKTIYFRSWWELLVAQYLDRNRIVWEYEKEFFKLDNGDFYLPDFFIYKNNKLKKIIEVKGYKNNDKVERFSKLYKVPIEIWDKQKLESLNIIHCIKIISIKSITGEQIVYDLQTTTENFFAENILVHNCYVNYGVRGYRLTRTTVVDPYYPEQIHKDIQTLDTATIAYISSFTEPFCSLEPIYNVTQRLSEAFTRVGLPIFYLTRQVVPDWGIEYLKQNKYSYLQYSVNTADQDIWKRLSPGAAKLEDIFNQIEKISKDIYVSWQVNPVIPGIVSYEELEALIVKGINIGVKHFIFKFVEQDIGNYQEFTKQLSLRFKDYPDRLEYFNNMFGESIGSQISIKYLLRRKWLEALKNKFENEWMNKATMSLCYEYKPDTENRGGVSLSPEFTTSHQCHGRRVPIFVKIHGKFHPLEECYGNCLYCEEKGNVACKNETLKQGKALEWKDWKKIFIL